jgi:hypothetical protein
MRHTGRTTRMLQYVIHRYRNQMRTVVVARDGNHMKLLMETMDSMLTSERDRALKSKSTDVLLFTTLATVSAPDSAYPLHKYDYRTNRFAHVALDIEVVFDHFAMETHLEAVIRYLKAAGEIADPITWMVDTARMLSYARRVCLIVPADDITRIEDHLVGYNVTVEDGTLMRRLNWATLERQGANSQDQILLFHPDYLQARFEGALSTITRF